MTDKLAGWYTDPSGMPNMFRWWDGKQWTTTLTSDPSAPPPASPSPVTPPSSSPASSSSEHATEPIQRPQQPSAGGQAPSGQPGQSSQTGQPDAGQAGQPTQPMQAVPPGQPVQPGQTGQGGQAGQQPPPANPFAPPGAHGSQGPQPQPQQGQPQQGQGVPLFAPGGGQQQRPPIPPPPGAPGPGYVPPPYDPMHQYTEVLSSDPGANGKSNRTALIIGGIGLAVVLIAAVIGGFWWVNRDKETPTASDNTTQQPTPEQTEPEDPQPTPEESLPTTPRTTPPDEQNTPGPSNQPILGRLTFTPLAKPWESSTALSEDLLQSTAQTYTTEEKWDGESNWVALASAGYANPAWIGQDTKQTANNIAKWFAESNFNGAQVGREPLGTSKIKVGDYDATLLKEHFSYNISGLKAKGETVSIVVVDIKGAPVPGVFLGSVPDTNAALQKDVQKAIDSLKVES